MRNTTEILQGMNIGFVTSALPAKYNRNREGECDSCRENTVQAVSVEKKGKSGQNAIPVEETRLKSLNATPVEGTL